MPQNLLILTGMVRASLCMSPATHITRCNLLRAMKVHQRAEMCCPKVLPSWGLGLGGGEGDVWTTIAISTVSLTLKGMPTCHTHMPCRQQLHSDCRTVKRTRGCFRLPPSPGYSCSIAAEPRLTKAFIMLGCAHRNGNTMGGR